jgi:AraC family transcriptional regulator
VFRSASWRFDKKDRGPQTEITRSPTATSGKAVHQTCCSANRGWCGLSAEVRRHGQSVFPWRGPQIDTHITVDISGGESLITRPATGIVDRYVSRRGTAWLCPPGWGEGSIDITGDLPGILHLYVSPSQFSPNKLGIDINESAIGALKHESAFEDPLLTEIAYAIASELQTETSAGSLLVESLASSIAARLVQKHASISSARSYPLLKTEGLDRRRLFRVLDYIEANLEGDLSIDRIASIACLSRYHFARAFKQAVGQPPHRYVSDRRLERAKALLIRGDRPLVDIALSLSFSSQANFTRAFRQATGQAPGQYRQTAGPRRPEFSLTDVRRSLPILA